ncbi:MAG: hypothetical protein LBH46_04510 [Rickettsiales bacterium]|jgi:DNA repair protein RadC|nr:hypothetical protein [Rickettsiales bacterium]
MSALENASPENSAINFEFVPLSEKTKLSITLHDFTENTKASSVEQILVDTLMTKDKSKEYIIIEQSQNDVIITCTQIGKYILTYSVKAKSDKKITTYDFRPQPNTQNKTIPIVLLMDNGVEHSTPDVMKMISSVLNSQQLKDIKKADIEFLKNISGTLKILTYKMESIK